MYICIPALFYKIDKYIARVYTGTHCVSRVFVRHWRRNRSSYEAVVIRLNIRTMAKRLYVGSLSYSTNDARLKEIFSEAGAVASANVIIDRMTGRSKGFGFVEMANDDDADKAIEMFNGKEIDGRKITVNEARPMTDRPPRREGGGFGRF